MTALTPPYGNDQHNPANAIPVYFGMAPATAPGLVVNGGDYESVLASANAQVLGPTGAVGDYLAEILIVPGTLSPGAVSIKDGSDTAITVFAGGANSVSNLVPFPVPVGAYSRTGAWQVTTGTNVTALGTGNFT